MNTVSQFLAKPHGLMEFGIYSYFIYILIGYFVLFFYKTGSFYQKLLGYEIQVRKGEIMVYPWLTAVLLTIFFWPLGKFMFPYIDRWILKHKQALEKQRQNILRRARY